MVGMCAVGLNLVWCPLCFFQDRTWMDVDALRTKILQGSQEWSYSEVDIALDSESIGRGFDSHYDQFFLGFIQEILCGCCFLFLVFCSSQ